MNAAPNVDTASAATAKSTSGGNELRRPQSMQSRLTEPVRNRCWQCGQRSSATKSSSLPSRRVPTESVIETSYTQGVSLTNRDDHPERIISRSDRVLPANDSGAREGGWP